MSERTQKAPVGEELRALWAEHARCVARADAAKAARRMAEWEHYSRAAADVLKELS